MDYNTFEMDPAQNLYHVVKFYDAENSLSGLHCIPASWIQWLDKDPTSVLLVYPQEPLNTTRERVENYESPDDNWHLFLAEIVYSSDFYEDAIHYINERENAEKNSAQVSKEIESLPYSLPNSLLSAEMDESAYLLEFEEEIHRQLSSGPHSFLVNTIDEIINSKSEISAFEMDQADVYEFKDDAHLNLPSTSSKTNGNVKTPGTSQHIRQSNNLHRVADNSPQTDGKSTLKHQKYSPGLVELMPNTGVYIGQAELTYCLRFSKTCTRLARLLTANIFTESALRTCTCMGTQRRDQDNRLDPKAVEAIINFVQKLEYKRSSRVPKIATIKSAIRYQMMMCKKNN